MKEVQVLLSSYNGEKYIKEQIDSILAQQGVKVRLLVRDDGSKDGTKEILEEYRKKCSNVQIIFGENKGVIDSFFELIEQAGEAEYFSFADQDDVWLPEKLFRAVTLLSKENNQLPLVYCSGKQLVDAGLKPIPAAITYREVRTEFGNALVENMCTGCTCVINNSLLKLLQGKQPEFTIMHDFWIYFIGTCFGKVIYDEQSYILYRQHGNNELGAASSLWDNYKRRIKNFKKHRGQLTKQAEELLRLYGKQMSKENRELAELLIKAKQSYSARKALLKDGTVFRQRKSDDRLMKILILFGLI